jgi:putative ABC transport system permease protein
MSGVRLASRLARREVLRRPGRTALVAVLVALPVAGMVLALVLLRTDDLSADERWQRFNGDSDALVSDARLVAPDVVNSWLPAGSRTVERTSTWTAVRTRADDRSQLSVRSFPADDPMVDELIDLVAGRLPAADDEVALSPNVARDLGVDVGDQLSLARPEIDLEVVGLVEDPAALRERVALVAPGGSLLAADPFNPPYREVLVDLPPGVDEVGLPDGDRPIEMRSDWLEGPQAPRGLRWVYVIGAVVLTVIGIVIAAAFAAGARRQLVMLGQLSSSGAPGRVLRTTLVLQGTVTGLVGAAAGAVVAAGLLAVGRSPIEQMMGHRLGPYDVRPAEIAAALAVGVAAATIAALIPAWSVVRVPTLTALAGRRPLPPVRHRVTAAGALAVTVGVGLLGLAVLGSATGEDPEIWMLVAIAGGVLELLGACAMAPAVVARLEPLAGRTRGAWRLAARSLARQRGRTGAVISAVAAAAGLAVGATALVAGNAAGQATLPELSDRVVVASEVFWGAVDASTGRADEVPRVPAGTVQEDLARVLPGARTVTVRTAGVQSDWPDMRTPVVADGDVLDAFEVGDDVRGRLDEDGIVSLDTGSEVDTLTLPDGSSRELPIVSSDRTVGGMWSVLVSPAYLDELGLDPTDGALVFVADRPLTTEQVDEIDELRSDWWADQVGGVPTSYLDVSVRWHEPGPTPVQVELIMAGLALLFAVLVVGASLALAAAESRDERDVLTVAGAPPGTLARAAGARAWLLAGIGAAMALPVGLLPVAVFALADDGRMQFVVPWRAIGLLAVALPAIVAVVALATSATAQRLRPVRVSTALFD